MYIWMQFGASGSHCRKGKWCCPSESKQVEVFSKMLFCFLNEITDELLFPISIYFRWISNASMDLLLNLPFHSIPLAFTAHLIPRTADNFKSFFGTTTTINSDLGILILNSSNIPNLTRLKTFENSKYSTAAPPDYQ